MTTIIPLNADPRFFDGGIIISPEDILDLFSRCDAAWLHDGDLQKPHAELTSGKCSNGFFDCMRVLRHPNICEILAYHLAQKLRDELKIYSPEVDWVVSSSYAAITFGHEVAKAFGAKFGFTEKDPNDPKKQVWQRFTIPKEATVLQVEELITTSGTFQEVRRAVKERNSELVNFFPVVGALVHRPPKLPAKYEVEDIPLRVVSLIEKEIWAVEPNECSLCKAGSKRLRPKTHWRELTGKA